MTNGTTSSKINIKSRQTQVNKCEHHRVKTKNQYHLTETVNTYLFAF